MSTPDTQPASDDSSEVDPAQIGAGFDFSDPNSPLAPYYFGVSQIIAVAFVVFVFLFFGVFSPLAHTDIWGHLKYGEWIVTHRALPERELFSLFSDQQQPYWNFQWLSQSILYLVYHGGELMAEGDELRKTAAGVEMLRTFHGLLIAIKVGLILLAIRRSTKSLTLAIFGAVVLFLLTMAPSRILRPQIFAEVLFALLIWWVSNPRLSRFTWLVVPAIFVLWANCHGSFAIGFLFLGLFCAGRAFESWWTKRPGQSSILAADSWICQGALALVLSPLAVSLLNPHGFELLPDVLKLAKHPNIRTIVEWSPLDFGQAQGGHWIYLATLGLIVISQIVSPRPLGLSRLIVMLAFVIGPLYQQRMLIWWLMLVPWLIAPLWKNTFAVVPRTWRFPSGMPSFRKTLIGVVLCLIGLSWSGFFQLVIGHEPLPLNSSVTRATVWKLAFEIKQGGTMPELSAALKKYPNHRFQGRIFAQDSLSDFLLWALPEKAPTLVYNHAHVFPEEVWQHQIAILSGGPGWSSLLDRYQVNLVVVDPIGWPKIADRLRESPDWTVILDEGTTSPSMFEGGVANTKMFIALRKSPL